MIKMVTVLVENKKYTHELVIELVHLLTLNVTHVII